MILLGRKPKVVTVLRILNCHHNVYQEEISVEGPMKTTIFVAITNS
jgi:hypothetical protein